MGWLYWNAKKHFACKHELSEFKESFSGRLEGGFGSLNTRMERQNEAANCRLELLEKDLILTASRMGELPTKDDVNRLEVGISSVSGDVRAVVTGVKGLERNLHLLMRSRIEGGE
ncbi:MAG: DUF2730 family protein [Deltaproteobacteria bacterium]|nr:DUF2730 family protein [Deltaproteobacteria bacterium]